MAPGFFLMAILALPAASEDYTVTLRLDDGLEERKAVISAEPNSHRTAVFIATTGARVETTLFNIMAVETANPRRVDLSYQIEWTLRENGALIFNRQAMDWSRIPENREVLLLEVDNRWRLWGTVATHAADSCHAPPKGGGLTVTARFSIDGIEHSVTRRTSDGVTSELTTAVGDAGFFRLSLTPHLLKDNTSAKIDALVSKDLNDFDTQPTTHNISLNKETELEDGVKITLATIPVEDAPNAADLNQRDPKTGWYQHRGKTLSFSYPPEWKLRETCNKALVPDGWILSNRTEPKNPLHAVHVWGFQFTQKEDELREEGLAELLEVSGGKCLVWRDEIEDPLCREKCQASLIARAECRSEKNGGVHTAFNFDLGKESGLDTKRYGRFLRFIKSFAF